MEQLAHRHERIGGWDRPVAVHGAVAKLRDDPRLAEHTASSARSCRWDRESLISEIQQNIGFTAERISASRSSAPVP
jgi:hypothetical protein